MFGDAADADADVNHGYARFVLVGVCCLFFVDLYWIAVRYLLELDTRRTRPPLRGARKMVLSSNPKTKTTFSQSVDCVEAIVYEDTVVCKKNLNRFYCLRICNYDFGTVYVCFPLHGAK